MQVLGLVRDVLPPITSLLTTGRDDRQSADDMCQRHYAVVESDHPYKPAAVHNYRVIMSNNL